MSRGWKKKKNNNKDVTHGIEALVVKMEKKALEIICDYKIPKLKKNFNFSVVPYNQLYWTNISPYVWRWKSIDK